MDESPVSVFKKDICCSPVFTLVGTNDVNYLIVQVPLSARCSSMASPHTDLDRRMSCTYGVVMQCFAVLASLLLASFVFSLPQLDVSLSAFAR